VILVHGWTMTRATRPARPWRLRQALRRPRGGATPRTSPC
jgi:hypothetical protein